MYIVEAATSLMVKEKMQFLGESWCTLAYMRKAPWTIPIMLL
jgi:hypothetical protein